MGKEVRGFCNETLGTKLTLIADILMHTSVRHDDELTAEHRGTLDQCWAMIYDVRKTIWDNRDTQNTDRNAASRYRGLDERLAEMVEQENSDAS